MKRKSPADFLDGYELAINRIKEELARAEQTLKETRDKVEKHERSKSVLRV